MALFCPIKSSSSTEPDDTEFQVDPQVETREDEYSQYFPQNDHKFDDTVESQRIPKLKTHHNLKLGKSSKLDCLTKEQTATDQTYALQYGNNTKATDFYIYRAGLHLCNIKSKTIDFVSIYHLIR